jgi:6-phosphogluconolactonase (cycloisomerase 2 family)
LLLLFVLASIAVSVSCGTTSSHYVYATLPAADQLGAYREDPNSGVLTELAGSPYSVGDGARSLVLHPSGKFLYAANPGQEENDISLFTIASDGSLTEVFPRTSVAPDGSLPQVLAMDPAGGFLYSANAGSANISVFAIDPNAGALTEVTGSPFTIGFTPLNMQVTPSGSYLYVTGPGQLLGTIATFSVNAGVLQLVSLTSSEGVNPSGLAIDPTSTYLYVANSSSNSLAIFTIASSGGLTQVPGSPLADIYNDPIALVLDPKGQYLYVANQTSNNVAVYSIDSTTGLPVALTTSTSTFAFATESSPSFLAEDPNGAYLFVGNQGALAGIQAFGLSGGNLNPLFTYGVGNSPTSIAVLQ